MKTILPSAPPALLPLQTPRWIKWIYQTSLELYVHISYFILWVFVFFFLWEFSTLLLSSLALPFWKKKKKNLTKRRLTLQILAILQIHFWSLLCKEKWKQRINLKVQFSDVPLWGSGLKIQRYHRSGPGHCCGAGSMPGLRTAICCGKAKKKNSCF